MENYPVWKIIYDTKPELDENEIYLREFVVSAESLEQAEERLFQCEGDGSYGEILSIQSVNLVKEVL